LSYPPDGSDFPEPLLSEDPLTGAPPPVPADWGQPSFAGSWIQAPAKFRGRLWVHLLLLIVTIVTTTLAGATHYQSYLSEFDRYDIPFDWSLLLRGLWYSATLLAILGSHEMGHYLLCRRYNVDATLPYFIPAPLPVTGTLGAVIKIREAFPNRRVLFDIGIAGPIAGFVVLVPALFLGLTMSQIVPAPTTGTGLSLGEPLMFRLATHVVFGTIADGYTVNMHPMVFAAWFGLLATALNLLPFGQLDGGHISYATLGRWSTPLSIATVASAVAMTFVSTSWLFMTVMMVAMLVVLGPRHPRVIYEYEPIGSGRIILAVVALVILVLCFTPVPIEPYDLIRNP
jgi:membrane-associated protease RseP (regulator of RpoE activity)